MTFAELIVKEKDFTMLALIKLKFGRKEEAMREAARNYGYFALLSNEMKSTIPSRPYRFVAVKT